MGLLPGYRPNGASTLASPFDHLTRIHRGRSIRRLGLLPRGQFTTSVRMGMSTNSTSSSAIRTSITSSYRG